MVSQRRSARSFLVVLSFLLLLLALVPAPIFAASWGAGQSLSFSSYAAHPTSVWRHHIVEYPIPPPGTDPHDITQGPDGNLWFVNEGAGVNGNIGKITPIGKITEYPLPDPTSGPMSITPGPDGNLWFTLYYSSQLAKINPSTGKVTLFILPHAPYAYPDDITTGPDGNLWFTQVGVNAIGKMTLGGKVTEYPLINHRLGNCTCGITVGPDHNLWIAEDWSNRLAKIDPHNGHVTEYRVPGPGYPPNITTGPDGNLWFTNFSAGQIGKMNPATGHFTEYNLPDPMSNPLDIVAFPTGGLWFTEFGSGKIGYITLSGTIKEFTVPGGYPWGITRGPDGNPWFAVQLAYAIGTFTSS